jgi:hypothetical protein
MKNKEEKALLKELNSFQSEVDFGVHFLQNLIYFVLIFGTMIIITIFYQPLTQYFNSPLQNQVNQAKTTQTSTNSYLIQSFGSNLAIADIGENLELKANSIGIKNLDKCSTPDLPEIDAGCDFTILTSYLDKWDENSDLKSIQLTTKQNPDIKFILSVKDFDKGKLTKSIGIISQNDLKLTLNTPLKLKKSEGINIRFWSSGQTEKISKIELEY